MPQTDAHDGRAVHRITAYTIYHHHHHHRHPTDPPADAGDDAVLRHSGEGMRARSNLNLAYGMTR